MEAINEDGSGCAARVSELVVNDHDLHEEFHDLGKWVSLKLKKIGRKMGLNLPQRDQS